MPQFKSEFRIQADHVRAPDSVVACGRAGLLPCMLLALLGSVPAAAQVANPSGPATASATLESYLAARSARLIDWLADGSLLIATRFGETQQIHRLRTPLGAREQLSFERADVIDAVARPYGGDALVYESSGDGGRTSSLTLMRLADHALIPLTHGNYRDALPMYAHDGARIAFSSDRGNGVDRAIYIQDTSNPLPEPRLVAGGAGERWRVFGWSPDDQRLLVGRESGGADDFELLFADLSSGALMPIQLPSTAPHGRHVEPPATLRARTARYAPDGRGLLVLGPAPGAAGVTPEFATLRYIDPGSGETRALLPDTQHEIELFDASADGRYLAYSINDDGFSRLMLIDQKSRLESAINAIPAGVIHSLKFDASGTHLALSVESAQSPEDVYVYEPGTQTLVRWSESERGPIDPALLASAQLRHFPTWDRLDGQPRQLSAYVYAAGGPLPPDAAPRPVLMLLRGVQGAQFRPNYDPFLQYLVNELHFVIVAPNLRGAGGYGRSFAALGAGALRDDAARDVGSLLAWVGLQKGLDRQRVIVMGEGAAAYLALAVLGQYADRLQGAIAMGPPLAPSLPSPLTIRQPVLLMALHPPAEAGGDVAPPTPNDAFSILAFRLQASGTSARYLALDCDASGQMRASARAQGDRAVAEFLAALLR